MATATLESHEPTQDQAQKWGSVKVTRLEITGLTKDARQRWKLLCEDCQQIENVLWEKWLVWHVNNGSREILKEWLEKRKAWHESPNKKGKGPALKLKPLPPDFEKPLYKSVAAMFPQSSTKTVSIIQQEWRRSLTKRVSANGSLSGWINILLNREGIPSIRRPQPIPFNMQNTKLIPPDDRGGNFKLELRLWRVEFGKMEVDTVEMWTKGRKRHSQSQILWRCLSGEYKLCGSKIQFSKGKVFVLVCYRMPQITKWLDESRVAFLKPCRDWPLKLRLDRNRRPGGTGRAVASTRRQLMLQRFSRSEGYRHAGSSNKGHGRKRAIQGVVKLSNRWKDFTKSWNHTVSTDIVRQCVADGFGRLVWFKPTDTNRDRLYLSLAGKVDGRREASSWDYCQLESMLSYKCGSEGILFEIH